MLVDLKTTSSPDDDHFCGTIKQYDYDRQAALYSDLLGAARFVIIGVQKPRIKRLQQTPEVWQFEATPAPGLLEQGCKKYTRLLRAYAERPKASSRQPRAAIYPDLVQCHSPALSSSRLAGGFH